ncbi:MAG: hypothetical protein WDN31_04350 [Hyphomicrobium sp.]
MAAASTALPEIDARTFLYLRDFLWDDIEEILRALPRATLIAPDRYVVEHPGYVAHLLKPDAARSVAIIPDMVEIPDALPATDQRNPPFLHLATVNAWKGHAHLIRAMARLHASAAPRALSLRDIVPTRDASRRSHGKSSPANCRMSSSFATSRQIPVA